MITVTCSKLYAVCCLYMSIINTVSDACVMLSVCLSEALRITSVRFYRVLVNYILSTLSDFFCIKLHCQTLRSIDTEGEADE